MPRPQSSEQVTHFGQALEDLLTQRGWNQNLLSKRTTPHVTQGMISNYKYGRRKPKRETITVIAKALVSHIESDSESQSEYKRVAGRLFDIAGFKTDDDRRHHDRLWTTIVENSGYDALDFDENDMDQIRHRVQMLVDSIASQKRKYQE